VIDRFEGQEVSRSVYFGSGSVRTKDKGNDVKKFYALSSCFYVV